MRGYHMTTRRRFLSGTGALAASAALPNVLFAHTGGSARLVVVILRGALDGLAAVPPCADPHYAGLHRELAIAAPGVADGALALDNTFGLHPSLAFLHEGYVAGELVVFHAVASPYRDRSHFDGQNVLEKRLTKPLARPTAGSIARSPPCRAEPPGVRPPRRGHQPERAAEFCAARCL